ncbi:MAG: DNA cytosine methyltransferase [Planctomycetota bacterium]|nr:DNA cytosine methyltransferase [Planctomycetota bacterium]
MVMQGQLTSLDLFCGCGGFTLGLKQAGLTTLAAIDFAPDAIEVFRANFPEVPVILERDLTVFPPEALAAMIGRDRVDVVVGGPPCQGFSNVRRRDGANHGQRIVPDERRELYKQFLAYVAFFTVPGFVFRDA